MREFLLILIASVFLGGAVAYGLSAWLRLSGVAMSMHGYIALGIGVVLTLALAGALMRLVFVSARRHDHLVDVRDE